MDQQFYYTLLYDMALASSGEAQARPLLTKMLQRMLYHTGFSCGFYLHPQREAVADDASHIPCKVEVSICSHRDRGRFGEEFPLPRRLLEAPSTLCAESCLGPDSPYQAALYLPVEGDGAFVLLAPLKPAREMPYQQLFEPILGNFSANLRLCRNSEAHTRHLEEEIAQHKQTLRELASSRSMLQQVLDSIPARVFWKDHSSTYLGANKLFAADAGLDSPEELIGKSDYEMIWGATQAEAFRMDDRRVMYGGEPMLNFEESQDRPDGTTSWVETSKIPMRDAHGEIYGILGTYHDITERKRMEQSLAQQRALLDMLHQAVTRFVVDASVEHTADYMLQGLLELTQSQYGFTGEVHYSEEGAPYFTINATNISAGLHYQEFVEQHRPREMMFSHLDNIFGQALLSGKTMISNDLSQDGRSKGVPAGHPEIENFLGVPIYSGSEIVGIYGIGNRPGGYDEEIVRFLDPYNATYGVLIQAVRTARAEQHNREQMLVAKEEAENASRAKSEFLSNMSHELRTPLNAILGFAQLLAIDDAPPLSAQQQESIGDILHAGEHLLELINDVLDLSNIDAGKIELSLTTVALHEVIAECQSLLLNQVSRRGLRLEIDQQCLSPHWVHADRTRLKQVLLNLLSNAIKYNREHGHIAVTLQPVGERLRIEVADSGKGIPQAAQGELFTAFSRLAHEGGPIEGTGIGLVISKNLMTLMGGDIGFESSEGKGSRFWIDIPSAQAGAAADTPDKRDEPHYPEVVRHQQYRVLYIDDNPTNLSLVSKLLARQPHLSLTTAEHPAEGLRLAAETPFDLTLIDINLPEMDGYEVLRRLRAQPHYRHRPILAFSADAMDHDIEKGLRAGFDDYLTKPLNIHKFISVLNGLLPTEPQT